MRDDSTLATLVRDDIECAALVRDDSGRCVHMLDRQRRVDPFATLGQRCLMRPIATLDQLIDRLLPEMIELADREEDGR